MQEVKERKEGMISRSGTRVALEVVGERVN